MISTAFVAFNSGPIDPDGLGSLLLLAAIRREMELDIGSLESIYR